MRSALLALPSLAAAAAGGDPPARKPTVIEPLPFSHAIHERTFRRSHLACIDCHPIGRVSDPPSPDVPPPRGACHACHLEEIRGVPHGASGQCALCHPVRAELVPADHGPGWRLEHAPAARALGSDCLACHASAACFACHDDRGPMSESPHGPGFRSFHGVQARLDPARCASCHQGETCVTCHATGSLPW